jgi:hypothetical protein
MIFISSACAMPLCAGQRLAAADRDLGVNGWSGSPRLSAGAPTYSSDCTAEQRVASYAWFTLLFIRRPIQQ